MPDIVERKLSAEDPANNLLDSDRVVILRSAANESDPKKRVKPTPLPVLAAALAPLLSVDPNHQPGGSFQATYATDADAAAYNNAGAVTLEYLVRTRSTLCHLGMRLTAELALNGAGHEYTLVYDGATRTGSNAPGLLVFRTGEMVAGDLVPARMVPADSAEVTAADYASFPAGFLFSADQLVRAYVPGTTAQQFASARFPGAHPAPTAALLDFSSSPNGADVNWKFVGRDAVPASSTGLTADQLAGIRNTPTPLTAANPAVSVADLPPAVDEVLNNYSLVHLSIEEENPPLLGSNTTTQAFRPIANSAYFFSDGGTTRIGKPTIDYGGPFASIRLAENATGPLTVYLTSGTASSVTVAIGETVVLQLVTPNQGSQNTAAAVAVWQIHTRSKPFGIIPTSGGPFHLTATGGVLSWQPTTGGGSSAPADPIITNPSITAQ